MRHKIEYLLALFIFFGFSTGADAEGNFDLTVGTNLARTDRLNPGGTFNLGPTGLRGWIYCDWPSKLPKAWSNLHRNWDVMDEQTGFPPYQILVTTVGANTPAVGVIAKDDVIIGVNGLPFTSDARKSFANAITDAEKSSKTNNFSILRWRAGVTSTVYLTLPQMGEYNVKAPYDCPKTTLIMNNAAKNLQKQILATGWQGAISALALLSTGDPQYLPMLQTYARSLAPQSLDFKKNPGPSPWDCYKSIFLSEYYMVTGDKEVFHGLSEYVIFAAKHSSMFGTTGHGFSGPGPNGSTHGSVDWYGPVNSAGLVAQLSIALGKKAGVVDPEIDPALARAAGFFGYYVNRGSVPYGEHEPWMGDGRGHSSNGKDALAAMLFANIGDKPIQTEYFTRMSLAAFRGEGYGHTGQGFSYLWTALAANIGGPEAIAQYQQKVRWHRDLSRRCDGSFTYDGAEQFGPHGGVSDYWAYTPYYDNPTAYYILHSAIPLKKLCITGKNYNPRNLLSPKALSNAIWAGEFFNNAGGYPTSELVAALGEYDPIVRNGAAQELGVRTNERVALVRKLLVIAEDPSSSNKREGACTALGYMGSSEAIPILVRRLTDKELWVRARAAKALTTLGAPVAPVAPHIPDMLAAFVANVAPTYPYEAGFNWNDPLQISNGYLSEFLFDKVPGETIKADRKLLWPAVRAGLKQPAGMWRAKLNGFVQSQLTLKDVEELAGDLLAGAKLEGPCDRMFTGTAAQSAMDGLAKYHVLEAVQECSHKASLWRNIASYGEAARQTLPDLYAEKDLLVRGDLYTLVTKAIDGIEAATKSPEIVPWLPLAIPQIVTTPVNKAKVITLTGSSRGAKSLIYTVLTKPLHGILTGIAPKLTYTPAANFSGVDGFTFNTSDGLNQSKTSRVNLTVCASGTGLKGFYYNDLNFTSPKVAVIDSAIDFDWGQVAPAKTVDASTFSVRWIGKVLAPESGIYRFSTRCSDGVRLWVNGVQVIDEWKDRTANIWNDSPPINLTGGQLYTVKMEYYKNVNPATARLYWYLPSGQDHVIIPQELLYPVTGVSLTSPKDGSHFGLPIGLPTTITLTADAAESGLPTNVTFYNGNKLIGSSKTPPYSVKWTNVVAGHYRLTARSTNSKGEISTSVAAGITVDLDTVPVATGLVCYFDAGVGISADINGCVSQWKDRSGNAHHAKRTNGTGPILVKNQINSRPALQIRGGSTWLEVFGKFFVKEQYVVVRSPHPTWSGSGSFLGRKKMDGQPRSARPSSFNLWKGTDGFWDDILPAAVSKNGSGIAIKDGSQPRGGFFFRPIDNYMLLKVTVQDTVPPVGDVAYQIGQNDGLGSCDMDIAEIIGYDHALSSDDEALVGSYLAAKYNIKTTYPSSKGPLESGLRK